MATNYNGIDAETRRRIEEEKLRRAAEEAQKKAAQQAGKEAAAAAQAAQDAQPKTQPPAPQPQQTESLNLSPEAPKASPYATPEEKAQAQGMRRTIQEYSRGVKTEVAKYGDVDLPEGQEHLETQINKANREGELPKGGTFGVTNQIYVDYKSIKNVRQAAFFGMTVPEADREQYLKEYARETKQDYATVLEQVESVVGDSFFSTPKSNGAKVRTANRALSGCGLMDDAGNDLDLTTAMPEEVIRAIRMNPDDDARNSAYKAITLLTKTPGSQWYGMEIDKGRLGFMDSADLTKKDYDDEIDGINGAFSIGASSANVEAYYGKRAELEEVYSDRPRVRNQMLAALDRSYSERTGMKPPPMNQRDAFFAEKAAREDAGEDKEDEGGEGGVSWWDRLWGRDGNEETAPDKGKAAKEVLDGMVVIDEDGKATFNSPIPGQDKEIGTSNLYRPDSGGSVISTGGAMSYGGQVMQVSAPIASTGSVPLRDLFDSRDEEGFTDPLGLMGEKQGAQLPTAVDRMIAADAPSKVTDENASVPYDPNMTEAQALLAYGSGQALDPRNAKLIEPYVKNKAARDIYNAFQSGYAIGEGRDAQGDLAYESSTLSLDNAYGGYIANAVRSLSCGALSKENAAKGVIALMNVAMAAGEYIEDPGDGYHAEAGEHPYDAAIRQNPELGSLMDMVGRLLPEQIAAEAAETLDHKKQNDEIAAQYRADIAAGRGTPEAAAWLAWYEQTEATDEAQEAAFADEGYHRMDGMLKDKSAFWNDKDGTFWAGSSAAAIEARNLRAMGGDKGAYKEFKGMLAEQTADLLWDLDEDAHMMGMDLESYLKKNGIDGLDGVIDMAFSQMLGAGSYIASRPDVQEALETISLGKWGVNAGLLGAERAAKKTGESVTELVGLTADDILHETNRFDIMTQYENDCGEDGRRQCRNALIAYANSGALSEESKSELLYRIAHDGDIYGVAADYLNLDGIQKWAHVTTNELQKDIETIDVVSSFLPESEQGVFKAVNMIVGSSAYMGVGMAMAATAPIVGPAAAGTLAAYLPGVLSVADNKEHYRFEKGASDKAAWFMAGMHFLTEGRLNKGGGASIVDDLFDGGDLFGTLSKSMRSNPKNGGKSLLTAARYALPHVFGRSVEEGLEEGNEVLAGAGLEILFDVVSAEIEAIQKGEGLSVTRPLGNLMAAIGAENPVEIGKEYLSNFGAGFTTGGFFSIWPTAWRAGSAMKADSKLRKYDSIRMAADMQDGKLPMTEETIGKAFEALGVDMQDPRYVKWVNGRHRAGTEHRNMVSAMLEGIGDAERKDAAAMAEEAGEMQKKADAAKAASDEAQAAYFDLCGQVANGDLTQIPAMEAAQTTWQRAQTAYNETSVAAIKKMKAAAEKVGAWMNLCKERAQEIDVEEIAAKLERLKAWQEDTAKALHSWYEAEQAAIEAKAEADANAAAEAEAGAADAEIAMLTDEEIDAQISAIAEEEGREEDARAEQDAMGYDEETLAALEEQVGNDAKTREARKNAIIRNQRNAYANLTARMEEAVRLEDADAEAELRAQRDVVAGRLSALGEKNAPEPTTDTPPARPVTASAPKTETAKAENAPEPTTTTKPAKPVYNTPERVAARKEQVAYTATGKTKAERDAEKAAQQAQKDEQTLQDKISAKRAELQAEFDKGNMTSPSRMNQLLEEIGLMEIELYDMQERVGQENQSIKAQTDEAIRAQEESAHEASKPVTEATETRKGLEAERKALKGVFRDMTNKVIYVNADQLGNMLYDTGAKNLTELNRMLGTRLTQDRSKGIPLDGGFYQQLKEMAPGYFREEWDAHPESAIVAMGQRKKALGGEIAAAMENERAALAAYEKAEMDRTAGAVSTAREVPPGYELSQFENRTLPKSDVSTKETDEALAGTAHKVHKQSDLKANAKRLIAQTGLKAMVGRLMSLDTMSDQDMETGYQCLEILKNNGDIRAHAMLAAKIGKVRTRVAQALRTSLSSASSMVNATIELADAYNRKKGRYQSINVSGDADAQMSLGETEKQPFMEAAVSRATADPVGQKLGSDVAKRSGLSVYWANMPDGIRGFFDRSSGVIVLNQKVGAVKGAYITAIHEFTHYMESDPGYKAYADAVLKAAYGRDDADARLLDEAAIRDEYETRGQELTDELLEKELVAAATEKILLADESFMRTLFEDGNGSVAARMLAGMDSFLRRNAAKKSGKEELKRYDLIQSARITMKNAVRNAGKWKGGQAGEAQAAIQMETQDRAGNRQQMISDPDTYDRITAEMPDGEVVMQEQPDVEQTRIEDKAQIGETVRKVLANIAAMNAEEDVSTDNPWGVPLNSFQRDQIAKRELEGVKLPGVNYNRATVKQRQLCAILSTPKNDRGAGVMTLTEQLDALEQGRLAVVTNADYSYILSQASIVEASETDSAGIPLTEEGRQAYARLLDAQANIQPTTLGEKFEAWRYISMLSSPVTSVKNIAGNMIAQEADRVSTAGVAWLDAMLAKKTGTRALGMTTRAERKAGTQASVQRGVKAFDDYFVAKANTSRSRNYEIGGDGRVYETDALEFVRNAIAFAMDAPDQMFMEKTIVEEMAVLKRLEAKTRDAETGEMRAMTEEEIYEEAYRRASNRFYHDSNAMTRILGALYKVPYIGTAVRVLQPFAKAPSNVAIRLFDYSPLGLAKSVFYDGLYAMNANKGENGVGVNFDQYKFVMGVGRGMTGTALAVVGGLLLKAGILEFGREDEENEKRRDVKAAIGEPYSMYVNIGNTKHEISFAQPAAAALAIGAGWAQRMGEGEDFIGLMGGVIDDMSNTFFDNSYLSGLNDLFRGYQDGAGIITGAAQQVAASYVSQMFSPALFRAMAKSMDNYARDTSSSNKAHEFLNKNIIQNWPFLRKTLPIRYDMTGDKMTQHRTYQEGGAWESAVLNFVDSFLSPTSTYSDKDDPQLIELLDLSYRTQETAFLPPAAFAEKNSVNVTKTLAKKMRAGDKAFSVSLTDEQQRAVNQMYSTVLFNGTGTARYRMPGSARSYDVDGLRSLMESREWQRMNDDERVKAVTAMKNTVKELVTVYVAENYR